MQQRDGIDHRRDEQPHLHGERHDVAHVAVADVDRRQGAADAQRGREGDQNQQGQEHDVERDRVSKGRDDHEQDDRRDGDVDQARHQHSGRDEHPPSSRQHSKQSSRGTWRAGLRFVT